MPLSQSDPGSPAGLAGRSSVGLAHDAFVYSSDDEFLAGAMPFLQVGVELGEPILAAPTHENIIWLRRELGEASDRVVWAENPHAHKPVERLELFRRFIADQTTRGARRIRLLGEPWPAESPAGIVEWKRYEAFLNLALAASPVWLVCPYDARELPDDVLDDARRTHPNLGHGAGRHASPDYLEPDEFASRLDRQIPLQALAPGAPELLFETAADARAFIGRIGQEAGLDSDRIEDAKVAVSEIVTNVLRHASGRARIRTWLLPHVFVCDVSDVGPGIDDPFAGYVVPDVTQAEGWGISIARQLCDVVEIRGSAQGTTVRVHLNRS